MNDNLPFGFPVATGTRIKLISAPTLNPLLSGLEGTVVHYGGHRSDTIHLRWDEQPDPAHTFEFASQEILIEASHQLPEGFFDNAGTFELATPLLGKHLVRLESDGIHDEQPYFTLLRVDLPSQIITGGRLGMDLLYLGAKGQPAQGATWIKNYSESVGLAHTLSQLGLVHLTGRTLTFNAQGDSAAEVIVDRRWADVV